MLIQVLSCIIYSNPSYSVKVPLRRVCNYLCTYAVFVLMYFLLTFQAESDFIFTPSGGELKPLEQKKVSIEFKPTAEQTLKAILEVQVEDGNKM